MSCAPCNTQIVCACQSGKVSKATKCESRCTIRSPGEIRQAEIPKQNPKQKFEFRFGICVWFAFGNSQFSDFACMTVTERPARFISQDVLSNAWHLASLLHARRDCAARCVRASGIAVVSATAQRTAQVAEAGACGWRGGASPSSMRG